MSHTVQDQYTTVYSDNMVPYFELRMDDTAIGIQVGHG